MKKIIFSIVVTAFVLASCKQNPNENHSTHMEDDNTMMHHDSTMMRNNSHNMNNDNMMMDNDNTMMHDKTNTMDHQEEMYACPMHPEVIGKKDEKCYKCGMKLTEPVPKE